MQYEWENRTDKGVAVNKKLDDMPQYNLTGASTTRYFTMYYSGMHINLFFITSTEIIQGPFSTIYKQCFALSESL